MRTTILIISLICCLPVSAATYKWVDENGVTQYGDTLPPGVVNRGRTEMNNKGQVLRKFEPALTPEQIKAQQADLAKQKELEKRTEERRRRDQALLGTYTAEQEIDLARDRNAQQIDSTIRVAKERALTSQEREKELNKQLAAYQVADKSGKTKTPPKELTEDAERVKKEQSVFSAAVAELERQKESVIARFNDDKLRFRELKQGNASSTPARETKSDRTAVPFAINESSKALVDECLSRWADKSVDSAKNYAASGELVQINNDKTELVLDGRMLDKSGKFSPRRVVCPLTADGKVDQQGIDVKKALASLGARY